MKKNISIIIIVLILLLLFSTICYNHSLSKIPFLDELRFGITPKEASRKLGNCYEITYDIAGTGKTAYRYKTTVLDHPADVICYFLKDKHLTEISITWDTSSSDMFNTVFSFLCNYYSDNKYFFVEDTQLINNQSRTFMGLDRGATGLYYTIISTTDFLTVKCVDNS